MAACLQGQQLSRCVTSTTRSRGCQESEEVPGFAVAVGEVVPRSGGVMVCRPMCLSPRTFVQPIQALVMSRRYFRFANAFLHILQSVYHWWCVYRVRLNLILTDTILRSQTPLPVSKSFTFSSSMYIILYPSTDLLSHRTSLNYSMLPTNLCD